MEYNCFTDPVSLVAAIYLNCLRNVSGYGAQRMVTSMDEMSSLIFIRGEALGRFATCGYAVSLRAKIGLYFDSDVAMVPNL
jgi:hypothetical protein